LMTVLIDYIDYNIAEKEHRKRLAEEAAHKVA